MKLILCRECQDVVKLLHEDRTCKCGKSHGRYITHVTVEVGGPCVVVGLDGHSLGHGVRTLLQCPYPLPGPDVRAWVFPLGHPRVKRLSGR